MTIEAQCEIAALRGHWEEAAGLVAAARAEALVGEQLTLPLFADRLEGRAAHAAGDAERAAELLSRSADGFAELGARWDETWSRLLLGEIVATQDNERAHHESARAVATFEQLGSVQEAERARSLLASLAKQPSA
jgi:hypothetical protein